MRSLIRGFLLVLASLWLAACGQQEPFRQESYVFGTRIEVLVVGVSADQARQAVGEVLREFDRLHRQYHAWQPSPMTELNAALAAGRRHEVSPEFAALLRQAQGLAAAGDYLFDPGIGRLVVDAISRRDYPIIQGVMIIFAAVYVLINLAIDISYSFLDPRIRYS